MGIFLDTLAGVQSPSPPLWMMRQAGRYLPEYRALRAKAPSFLDFCYNPDLAAEATLQPIMRFGFDAAILFSDILVVPDGLGQRVNFETGEGPRLEPIEDAAGLARLHQKLDLTKLAPVLETVRRVRARLATDRALIGFCGAPWTVASYMVAGRGTPDQAPARLLAYEQPDMFRALIDLLVGASIDWLSAQIEAGVDAVQIFDSWAGVLPAGEFEAWCEMPMRQIIAGLKTRHPGTPVIAFPRGAGTRVAELAERLGAAALGIDTAADPRWVAKHVGTGITVQGNLDPLVLLAGGEALDRGVDTILEAFAGRRHIFNLGHGIVPPTPIAHVERMLKRVRGL